jgi:hypothetical protein
MLRGALGDVEFFPWGRDDHQGRLVAVVGMGRPGTFDRPALRQLVRSLMFAVGGLPGAQTVGTVLIGSGEGTLSIADAVSGLVRGMGEAIDEMAASEDLRFVAPITVLRIAERERGRAQEIHAELTAAVSEPGGAQAAGRRVPVDIDLPGLKPGKGGTVSIEESIALLADSALELASDPGARSRAALEKLLRARSCDAEGAESGAGRAAEAGSEPGQGCEREALPRATRTPTTAQTRRAVRVSFWDDGRGIRGGARSTRPRPSRSA